MKYQVIRRKVALGLATAGFLWLMLSMAWATFQGTSETLGESSGTVVGLAALMASLVLYLTGKWFCPQKTKIWYAMTALHTGLLLMIAGFAGNAFLGEKGFVYIREGDTASFYVDKAQKEHPLPFSVGLKSFQAEVYSGTLRPRGFTSEVFFVNQTTTQTARISVNESASFGSYRFYQQSYGVEMSDISRLVLEIVRPDGTKKKEVLAPGAASEIEGCGRLVLTDFVPTAEMEKGRLMVRSEDVMLAPAYRFLSDFTGETAQYWVLAGKTETETVGFCRVHPEDFEGVRYTVLSVVRAPLDYLIFLGAVLAVAGAAVGFVMGRK